jgi:hypothetical protein
MKKQLQLIVIIAFISNLIYAQTNDADKFEILVGGSFAKPKIIPKLNKLALAQLTINYKLTTTARSVGNEKSTGAKSGAKITAYLETTDGALTEADFQEVSDYFYFYFQKKLKENGIDTVAWNTITGTDFYKNVDKEADKGKEKGENVWVTNSAHKGNEMYGGNLAFAFGKIKKATNFCEQVGAPAGFFHLTVDFADVLINVNISTSGSGLYSPQTRTTKTNWAVNPEMKVISSKPGDFSLFWNEKTQGETLVLKNDIDAGINYIDKISEDTSRLKNSLWAFSKEMDPVVIETTKEKYKAAAKKALEKYVDAFIAKTKLVK